MRVRLTKSAVTKFTALLKADVKELLCKASVPFAGGRTRDDAGAWSGADAEKRLAKWASSDGSGDTDTIDWAKYRKGFAVYEPDAADTLGGYGFAHHDVDDEGLFVHRGGMIAAGGAAEGSRGATPNTEAQKHLTGHYKQFDMVAPWDRED